MTISHAHVSAISDDGSDVGQTAWNAAHTVSGAALSGDVTASGLTMNTARLLGRTSGSSGAVEEITVGSGLLLASTTLSYTASRVLQYVYTETGAVATGTTIIPLDNTIPQITEGDQYMSLTITPTSATSTLIIDVIACCSATQSGANSFILALFQDTTANALASMVNATAGNSEPVVNSLRHIMTSGTTGSTTFKVRLGCSVANTLTFNGTSGNRLYGGVIASSIIIREVV